MSEASIADKQEIVVPVHGTFAGDVADEGSRWWQRGSDTWQALQARLPQGATLHNVFHWEKGANSARGRLAGALDLLEKLKEFESNHQGYHLVGHSHGGSVIWECLQQAVIQRKGWRVKPELKEQLALDHLRSWTTLGTPFMQFGPDQNFTTIRPFRWFARLQGRMEQWMSRFVPRFLDSIQSIIVLIVFLIFMALLVVIWVEEPNSAPAYFVSGIFIFFFFMLVFFGGLEKQIERMQFHRERDAVLTATKLFGDRWFGIYSKEDEAITGLQTTLSLKLKVIPQRTLANQVFYSDRLFRWLRPLRWISYRLYNRIIPRLGDRFISSQLVRSAQGNDRPGTVVQHVSPGPVPCEGGYLPLPESVNASLVEFANDHAKRLVPELRKMLGNFAVSGLQVLQEESQRVDVSKGLVHNAYFESEEVLQLIAWHVGVCSKNGGGVEIIAPDQALVDWANEFKANVAKKVIEPIA